MPTPYESAVLNLRLYELRREPVLREARDWFSREFDPDSFAELVALASGPRNASIRMVLGYWDMAASLVTTGAIDAEAFLAAHGEIFLTFSKIHPFLTELRRHRRTGVLQAHGGRGAGRSRRGSDSGAPAGGLARRRKGAPAGLIARAVRPRRLRAITGGTRPSADDVVLESDRACLFIDPLLPKLERRPSGRGRKQRDAAAEQDWNQGHLDAVDQARRKQAAKQLAAAEERDVLARPRAQVAHDRLGVGLHRELREIGLSERAREHDVPGPRRRLRVAPHPQHRLERLAAYQERVERGRHGSEIEVRIHDDPVVFAVGPGDVPVEAHCAAISDKSHSCNSFLVAAPAEAYTPGMPDRPIVAKLTCAGCRTRLEVTETPSGGRAVSVIALGRAVEDHAKALERFVGPDFGPEIVCPACNIRFDPAAPYVRPRLRR